MAKIKEFRYIQFPLCLLMETYMNANNGLNLILHFGVVNFAKKLNYNITEVARQLMYCYYRKKELLPDGLLSRMNMYINNDELSVDECYCGFNDDLFDPLEYTTELIDLFEKDEYLKNNAILLYQVRQACSSELLGVSIGNMPSILKGYETGNKIRKDFEVQFGTDVIVSVKIVQIFEFRESGKDLDLFRAYLGIKSLIGTKDFVGSNKPAILSRMIGCKSKEAFEHYTTKKYSKNSKLLEVVKIYGKRYQMNNLLKRLIEKKFMMYLSIEKRSIMYFSKYMEPEQLTNIINESKANSIEQRRKNAAQLLQ